MGTPAPLFKSASCVSILCSSSLTWSPLQVQRGPVSPAAGGTTTNAEHVTVIELDSARADATARKRPLEGAPPLALPLLLSRCVVCMVRSVVLKPRVGSYALCYEDPSTKPGCCSCRNCERGSSTWNVRSIRGRMHARRS